MTTQPISITRNSKADAYTCKPGTVVERIMRAMLPVGKVWTYDEIRQRTGMTTEQIGGSLHHPMKIGVVERGEHRGKTAWRLLKDPLPKKPAPKAPESVAGAPILHFSALLTEGTDLPPAEPIGPPIRLDLHQSATQDKSVVPDKGIIPTLNLRLKAMTERADAISKEMDKLQAELTAIEEQEQAIRRARDLLVQAGVE